MQKSCQQLILIKVKEMVNKFDTPSKILISKILDTERRSLMVPSIDLLLVSEYTGPFITMRLW